MKTSKIICFLLLICSSSVFAQKTANTWYFLEYDWVMETFQDGKYYLASDTVLEGKVYRSLIRQGGSCGGSSFMGGLRQSEDGMQVYWYSVNQSTHGYDPSGQEYLLYDFSAEVGDTIRHAYMDKSYLMNTDFDAVPEGVTIDTALFAYIVREKKEVNGRIQMTLDVYYLGVVNPGQPSGYLLHTVTWLQGIGTPQVLWPSYYSYCALTDMYAVCVLSGDEILYSYDMSRWGITTDCSDWHWHRAALEENRSDAFINDSQWYNVLGQPVDENYKGIVIQNGKKKVQ